MKVLREDLFDLNPRRRIHSKRIGESRHHLLIIDDLFLYPRDISKLMDELHYTDDEEIRRATPAYRCVMNFPRRDEIYRVCFEQHFKVYPEFQVMTEQRCAFDQYYDRAKIISNSSYPPHVDIVDNRVSKYAFVIYMNERNIHGGTQFLRHTVNGKDSVDPPNDTDVLEQSTTIRLDTPWDYEPLEWQRYYLAPMRFNRLVSYRNNILHSIYTDGSFYRNTPRKTIVSNF